MANRIQEDISVSAPPARVYGILTDATAFSEMTGNRTASIEATEGGAFALFDGMISGRTIELVPGERIVQAWRAGNWPEGTYSIVRFELVPDGNGTRIAFEHQGFPDGEDGHLKPGWHANYWDPLKAYLN